MTSLLQGKVFSQMKFEKIVTFLVEGHGIADQEPKACNRQFLACGDLRKNQ